MKPERGVVSAPPAPHPLTAMVARAHLARAGACNDRQAAARCQNRASRRSFQGGLLRTGAICVSWGIRQRGRSSVSHGRSTRGVRTKLHSHAPPRMSRDPPQRTGGARATGAARWGHGGGGSRRRRTRGAISTTAPAAGGRRKAARPLQGTLAPPPPTPRAGAARPCSASGPSPCSRRRQPPALALGQPSLMDVGQAAANT